MVVEQPKKRIIKKRKLNKDISLLIILQHPYIKNIFDIYHL